MKKYIYTFVIVFFLLVPCVVYPMESVNVVVLPFKIDGGDELIYLSEKVPQVIGSHIQQDGATIKDPSVIPDFKGEFDEKDIGSIRGIGIKCGADYVIWGKLKWTDEKYVLNAYMVESFGDKPRESFTLEGEGIEKLPAAVKKLADIISTKLFDKEKIAKVLIAGNKRIEADAIKRMITTKPGEVYLAKTLTEDLKAVYAMGYFDDIRIETEKSPEGKIVIFKVKEKPTVRKIIFKGNFVYKEEEIKENLAISTGSILNIFDVRKNMVRIEELYKDKHYNNVKVSYKIHELKHNQADLEFIIEEGEKVLVKEINLLGNSAFTDKELKKFMKTKEKGFFSFITSSGEFFKENLKQDTARLYAYYHNNGYIHARIGEPKVEYKGRWIYITIKIDEGVQFRVGNVDLEGDLISSKEKLLQILEIKSKELYNRETIHNDVLALTDLYSNSGYAYADITPRLDRDMEKKLVNITYLVSKGKLVYFEKIIISGNSKTRDKVIRRELPVCEQGLYNGFLIKRAERNLNRLDFFEEVKVNTSKGSADDKMILKVDVKEKATGSFSFGGGYSTADDVFAMVAITQRNLFGRGQRLSLKAELGGRMTSYILDFTEPWLFDIPLTAGFNIYDWEREYNDYDTETQGGGIFLSYPFFDYTRVFFSYHLDISEISNFDIDVADSVLRFQGDELVTSSVTVGVNYDSRNRVFNATEGADHSLSVEYAGLGGDIGFTKVSAKAGWYIPLFWKFVGFIHSETGFVWRNTGGELPDYQRFYIGGIDSLRGFEWDDLSPRETNMLGYESEIGGNKFVQFNFEWLYPISKDSGVMGLVFFDTGDVYKEGESIDLGDLRESAGFGIRWNSPMGPLRIEYGHILDPKKGEGEGGRWEFAMGAAF